MADPDYDGSVNWSRKLGLTTKIFFRHRHWYHEWVRKLFMTMTLSTHYMHTFISMEPISDDKKVVVFVVQYERDLRHALRRRNVLFCS